MKNNKKHSLQDFQKGKQVKTLLQDQKKQVKGGIVVDDISGV